MLADEAQAWWYELIQVLKRTTFAFLAIFVASASIQYDHVFACARMRPISRICVRCTLCALT